MKTVNNVNNNNLGGVNMNKVNKLEVNKVEVNKAEVTDILEVIGKEVKKVEKTPFYKFVIGNKLYFYNSVSGNFYSYKHKLNNSMILEADGNLAVVKFTKNKKGLIGCKYTKLIENDNFVNFEKLNPVGFARGGVNGVSYIGLSFFMNGKNYKVFSHTVVAVIKYGYKCIVNDCLGKGSYYVIDHVNGEKTFNSLQNIQILTRRDNRWGK